MAAARGDEHVEQRRTKECEQRVGHWRRDADAGIADNRSEADAALTDASDDAHDAGIERELQDDARRARRGLAESPYVGQWCAVEEDAEEEEYHDDGTEVEGSSPESQVEDNKREPQQRHQPGEQTAVLQPLGGRHLVLRNRRRGMRVFRLVEERGRDSDDLVTSWMHQRVDDSNGDYHQHHYANIDGMQYGLRDWERVDDGTAGGRGKVRTRRGKLQRH